MAPLGMFGNFITQTVIYIFSRKKDLDLLKLFGFLSNLMALEE